MLAELRRPGLVVVDMQNDFVRAGAPLEVEEASRTIRVIADLLADFRAAELPVIFTRYVADARFRPLARRLPWITLLDPPVSACVPGRRRSYEDCEGEKEGVAVIDELLPLPAETVVDKPYFSAFHETALEHRLAELGIDSLVITGTITEMCVEDTARHAVHFGYPTVIVSDAVSSDQLRSHKAALAAFDRNYGWVMDSQKVRQIFRVYCRE